MKDLIRTVGSLPRLARFGSVAKMEGLLVDVTGAAGVIGLGETPCEVVGFRDGRALAMPFDQLRGVTLGARATFEESLKAIHPCTSWLGWLGAYRAAPMPMSIGQSH